ncbi:EI24 domain-containing protein [Piscinibacter sp.]|jgi:MFS family permease|uniref:EI24 domain-containing protein n=1 Tax=Piscinibacter sp. TaxID=1903157 RepID=UPI0035597E8F
MNLLLDSFWRAAAYCLHPRVIMLSVLPLVLMAGSALALGYFFWEPALDAVNAAIASWELMSTLVAWLEGIGLAGLRAALAPLVVVFISTPIIVVVALLVVAVLMTPAIVALVAARRFPSLQRERGGSMLGSAFGSLWATVAALLALFVSVPLWFVPPLVLIVPPLIWGWLAYRVLSYDVLAEHASREERRELIRRHRGPLFGIGVVTGYLGAAPSLVWASGAMAVVLAPVLVPLAIWVYTLVFAFATLWFAHYALSALQGLRAERDASAAATPSRPVGEAVTIDAPPPLPPLPPM